MRAWLLAGVAIAGLARPASAAVIMASYEFDALFASGPYSTIHGEVALQFDPSAIDPTAPVTSFSSNLPSQYLPASFASQSGYTNVGDDCNSFVCSPSAGFNDFVLGFEVDPTGSVVDSGAIVYSLPGAGLYVSLSDMVTVDAVTAVPEPVSLSMLSAGMVSVVVVRRRRAAAMEK